MITHSTAVTYSHPDGAAIKFDAAELRMTASDGVTTVCVDIGPLGMIQLGQALIQLASPQQEMQ